jgi:hypothetical protein
MNLRKQWLRACLVAALSCAALPQVAMAAELDAQRQAMMVSMFKDDAVLTEQMHREFWAGLKDTDSESAKASMDRLSAALKNSIEFERATVVSYKASIKQRKPVIDPSYELALKVRLEMIRARNMPADAVLAKDKAFRESLVPVSKGKSFDVQGTKIVMNEQVIDKALKSIEASYARLERLLNPVWTPAPAK